MSTTHLRRCLSRVHRVEARTKTDRFSTARAFVILVLTFIGFQPYYTVARDSAAAPSHGDLSSGSHSRHRIVAWVVLFLVQSSLIPSRHLRLHRKLGWSALVSPRPPRQRSVARHPFRPGRA